MLRAAGKLMQTQGFHGTGLSQILAEAEAPRGSLYFHFPGGKEQLAVEALQQSSDWVGRALAAAFDRAGGDVRAGLRAFAAAFAEQLEQSAFAEGCPVATVALETSILPPAIRRVCEESYASWHGVVRSRLVAAGATPARADKLATLYLAAIEGALVLAKARRDAEPLRLVAQQLEPLLADALSRRARPGRRRPAGSRR
jgi:AcrR family transcriptional regulator